MIKIYDTLYLAECETDNTKTDVLLGETNKVEEVANELTKAINICKKKYHTNSYYIRELVLGNVENRWNEDCTELIHIRNYDKWYLGIDWGSHTHFIRIAFDTETEYNNYLKLQGGSK